MLHVEPEWVLGERATAGETRRRSPTCSPGCAPRASARSARPESSGDPDGATAEEGAALLDDLAQRLVGAVRGLGRRPAGRLREPRPGGSQPAVTRARCPDRRTGGCRRASRCGWTRAPAAARPARCCSADPRCGSSACPRRAAGAPDRRPARRPGRPDRHPRRPAARRGCGAPRPAGRRVADVQDVTVVVPVRDRPGELARLLAAVRADPTTRDVAAGRRGRRLGRRRGDRPARRGAPRAAGPARHVPGAGRRPQRRAPGRHRPTWWRSSTPTACPGRAGSGRSPRTSPTPALAVVAPRILGLPGGSSRLARGLRRRRRRARHGAVTRLRCARCRPSRTCRARRSWRAAPRSGAGFDESMRVAEDVDLVWRLAAAGWRIRYEPRAVVRARAPGRDDGVAAPPRLLRHRRGPARRPARRGRRPGRDRPDLGRRLGAAAGGWPARPDRRRRDPRRRHRAAGPAAGGTGTAARTPRWRPGWCSGERRRPAVPWPGRSPGTTGRWRCWRWAPGGCAGPSSRRPWSTPPSPGGRCAGGSVRSGSPSPGGSTTSPTAPDCGGARPVPGSGRPSSRPGHHCCEPNGRRSVGRHTWCNRQPPATMGVR